MNQQANQALKGKAFEELYSKYAALFEPNDITCISENTMWIEGSAGILLMLAQLYKNPPSVAEVFEKEIPEGGLDSEICKLGTVLLDREVTQYDKQVISHLVAVRHEISDEAFDALTQLIENPPTPNQALIDLMKRKSRWE